MVPDQAITDLLNEARVAAVKEIGEVPAVKSNLDLLASLVHRAIIIQVALGRWAEHHVTTWEQMNGLVVTARLNKGMLGPPILIDFDFKNTALRMLVVNSTVV